MERHVTVNPLPFFYVGKTVSSNRVGLYRNNKHNLLSDALGKPDTKSIWYSKEHFEKLVAEIDYAGGDGVRVFFGMYEEGHEFEGQLCLLFCTTRENIVGSSIEHTNVILENEPDFEDRNSMSRDIITFPGDLLGDDIKDFNLGSACPPRCDADFDIYP